MLQECLDVGMLQIGDEDEKFQSLLLASQDLKVILLEDQAKLIPFTLVALDPRISPDEPTLLEVENAIKVHWKAFKNRFADTTPLPLLRAVVLEALELAAQEDANGASIVWLTGSSFLPFAKLGREEEICKNFLNLCGQAMEKSAIKEWQSVPSSAPKSSLTLPKTPAFKAEAPEVKNVSVNQASLIQTFSAAVGMSTDAEGNAISEPNQYPMTAPNGYGQSTVNQSWGPAFAKRAATGLAQTLNTTNKTQSQAQLSAIAEMLESFGGEVSKYLPVMAVAIQKAVDGAVQRSAVVERESSLLWWDRTLYSESFRCSYRSLDPCVAVVLMAHDLGGKIPVPHPQSIEYLLREVVRDVVSSQDTEEPSAETRGQGRKAGKAAEQLPEVPVGTDAKTRSHTSLKAFFGSLKAASEATQLASLLECQTDGTGRACLLQFLCDELSGADLAKQQITARLGVEEDTNFSLESLAVWVFRDLQAQRLAG